MRMSYDRMRRDIKRIKAEQTKQSPLRRQDAVASDCFPVRGRVPIVNASAASPILDAPLIK
jgi:hypothetical protein